MNIQFVADLIVVIHLMFVLFVVCGGALVFRWPWISLLHIPSVIWAILIEFFGWICPLTPLEQKLRLDAGIAGYTGSFIEHYVLPILYPHNLTRIMQIGIGTFVLILNCTIYAYALYRYFGTVKQKNL